VDRFGSKRAQRSCPSDGRDVRSPLASPPAPQPPDDDAPLIAAEERPAADAGSKSLSRTRRFVKALGKQPAWVVAAILTGAISQIEVHAFEPVAHGIAAPHAMKVHAGRGSSDRREHQRSLLTHDALSGIRSD
jgi:hypothetical protein